MNDRQGLAVALIVLALLAANGFSLGLYSRANKRAVAAEARVGQIMGLGEGDTIWHIELDQVWGVKKGGK